MIGSVWGLLVVGAILASSAMALMWVIQVRIRDASHVDVAWAVLIACCAIVYALLADGDVGHRILAASLASIWGFRLGGYLLFNRVLGKEEDGRYQELRRRWAPNANRNFFVFFQAQAAVRGLLLAPVRLHLARDRERIRRARMDRDRRLGDRQRRGRSSPTTSSRSGARIPRTRGRLRAAASGAGRATRTTSSSG